MTKAAVFLSYASQDAEVVARIAEALRAAGVEVWFDQNELVGGDAWDAKIRGQIASCALFVPIISAATQARREGYFRLEWKLGAQRTHMMSERTAFLLPVVIDATRDAEADVPGEFRAVQWTRLPGGEGPAVEKFCARVGKLLGGSVVGPVADRAPDQRSGLQPSPAASASNQAGRRVPAAAWGIAAAVLVAALGVAGYFWSNRASESAPTSASQARAGARPAAPEAPAAPLSEARRLVAQARALFDDGDQSNHENFFLADDLLKRALTLDATDGEVWAAQAQLSGRVYFASFDRTTARREAMRMQAERAVKLAPGSVEAQLAMAGYLTFGGGAETASEAVQLLHRLAEQAPQIRRIFWTLGSAYSIAGNIDESAAAFRRGNLIPGGDPEGLALLAGQLFYYGRYAEVEEVVAQSLALRPVGRAQLMDVQIKLSWRGDLDGAAEALARWPAWLRLEDRGGFVASQLWMWRREPDKAIAALNTLSRDFLNDSFFTGPKAGLLALAHELADRPQAARQEWENARRVTERVIAGEPANRRAAAWRAIALAKLGQQAEAEKLLGELEQLRELRSDFWSSGANSALLRLALGRGREVAAKFDAEMRNSHVKRPVPSPQAALRLNPVFDPIREMPEFRAWLAAAPAPKAPEKSVAVLAFANQSDDKANEYFSDGISEELLNVLAKIPGLKVSARTSAFYFKGKQVPIAEVARQLGVAYVVEGSVRKAGEKVRITAQLIKASDGFHVWGDTFTRELKDIFAVQDEIAGLVAKQLALTLAASSSAGRSSVNPQAFELYVQARQDFHRTTAEGHERARQLLTRALALEPGFARAHALLSDVLRNQAQTASTAGGFAQRDGLAMSEIMAQAQQAVALDGELPEARVALGAAYWMAWRFEDARRELGRAIALNANLASAHQLLARVQLSDGRMEDALLAFERAVALDPLFSRLADNYSSALYCAGRLQECIAQAERALALQPQNWQAVGHRMIAWSRMGRTAEAAVEAKKESQLFPGDVAYVLVLNGERAAAEQHLIGRPRTLREGRALAALGRLDDCIAAIQSDALVAHGVEYLHFDPVFDPIRQDPRVRTLLDQCGATEAHTRAQAWRAANPPGKAEAKR